MTIDEAIEELSHYQQHHNYSLSLPVENAIKLGKEALKKWRLLREGRAGVIDPLLPGETRD